MSELLGVDRGKHGFLAMNESGITFLIHSFVDNNYSDHVEYVQAETNLLYPATFVLTMNN